MRKILILFTHPIAHKSRVNIEMVNAVKKIEGVTIHDLYEEYPDFYIDVKREQELLLEHDVIIWQHPFYWYSAPSLLKEWFDLVLEHGFAYGNEGEALKGKVAISVITTGGKKETYSSTGFNSYPITQFLLPYKQSCKLCQINYLPPFVVHGTHLLSEQELEVLKVDYVKLISLLKDEQFKLQDIDNSMFIHEYLND
jgi:glutathione-regulated potassium-efflux system ancillary protein KefG